MHSFCYFFRSTLHQITSWRRSALEPRVKHDTASVSEKPSWKLTPCLFDCRLHGYHCRHEQCDRWKETFVCHWHIGAIVRHQLLGRNQRFVGWDTDSGPDAAGSLESRFLYRRHYTISQYWSNYLQPLKAQMFCKRKHFSFDISPIALCVFRRLSVFRWHAVIAFHLLAAFLLSLKFQI